MSRLTTKTVKKIDLVLYALTIVLIVASCFFYGSLFKKTASKTFTNSENYYSINKITELTNQCASLLSAKRLDLYLCDYNNTTNYIEFNEDNEIIDISLVIGYKSDKYYYYHLVLDDGKFELKFLESHDSHQNILKYQLYSLISNLQTFPRKEILKENKLVIETDVLNDISSYSNDYYLNTPRYAKISSFDIDELKGYFSSFWINENQKIYYKVEIF